MVSAELLAAMPMLCALRSMARPGVVRAVCSPARAVCQPLRPTNLSSALRNNGLVRRQLCSKPKDAAEAAAAGGKKATATAAAAAGTAAAGTAAAATGTAAAGTAAAGTAAAAAAEPLFVASDWLHFGVAIGAFYAANHVLYKAFAAAEIKFPASLVGMFGILGGLWTLSGTGQVATADKIVAAAMPALKWITRYLPLFYVPALVVLPLAIESLSGGELGRMAVVLGAGMPFTLLSSGVLVLGIRKLASVALLPVPPVPKPAPFTMLHIAGCAAVAVGSALGLCVFEEGSTEAWGCQQLHLLAWTVGGLVFGSIPPAFLAATMPHPVVATTIAAHCGVLTAGLVSGVGYWDTLRSYLTKGKGGASQGAGDVLMSFLGVVVLTFGFHIYGQRALLVRHAAEVVGCAVIASLLSMVVTAAAGRATGLQPELSLALVPRSVTVALAMPIASQLGVSEDVIPICAASVLVTGLVGAVMCQRLLTMGGFADPLSRGLATASSCHGFGTAALAATEPAALPFCALSYGLTGIAASLWAAVPAVQSMLRGLAGA